MPISSFFFNLRCAPSSRTYSIHHVMHALERYASSTGPDKASIDPPVRPSIWTVSFAFLLAPHQIPPRNDVDARPERCGRTLAAMHRTRPPILVASRATLVAGTDMMATQKGTQRKRSEAVRVVFLARVARLDRSALPSICCRDGSARSFNFSPDCEMK